MYGISRIDDDTHYTHAWRVSLRRRGKALVKNFPDKKYGGKRGALAAARKYRDQLLEQYPPLTRKEFASIRRCNNKTGITGVYRYAKKYRLADGREKEHWYWEAHWPTESGQHESVSYSVNNYGEDLARHLAIRARQRGVSQVQGIFWASERAERRTPSDELISEPFSSDARGVA
ncbi:AP2 domain-containing protein [Chromatocurvus halotolerans]|uniref:AP2 domain-containing protein n=1 Tax=Chromatocurvus halotolerans TaxID=1132028 RepID=A0A4R2L461_9GAMM|nr:AP2 domain-containing protein [Chromatocurvus halotolerans]